MKNIFILIAALASLTASASSPPSQPGVVGTTGPMTFTISLDGRMVTVHNEKLHRSIQVDAVQTCGARAVGDTNKHDVEITDSDLRMKYATRCTLKIMMDATLASCDGCNQR